MDHLSQAIEPCGIVLVLKFPFLIRCNGGELCSQAMWDTWTG